MSDPAKEETTLPRTMLTLDDARSKLAGWHFAQEALSQGEREILYVAEALLRLLDAHPRRCDAPSPTTDHLCDLPPGHELPHANAEGYEWKRAPGG